MDVNSLFSFQQSREGLLMPCFTSSKAVKVCLWVVFFPAEPLMFINEQFWLQRIN